MELKNSFIISQLRFKGCWRSYQQRVLDELEYHLDDNKLNVVAAPGAGKTTLGIEVILRLKNPAFILAPTITIKNQWKQRILDNFLPSDFNSDLISTDIKNLSEITVSTYQGLHSLYKNIEERENFIKQLKDLKINTLVLDEAHHLRTEWWATLNSLYKELNNENFKIVSLTGTPPYDVSPAEWNNYNSLCGPVDAEISIPELVKAGDLCPHQDLIYFSNLTSEEEKIVFDFEEKRNAFFKDINEHSDVLYAIEGSAFITNLDNNVDIIYKNTNFTVALISYLLHEDELDMNARILTEFLGLTLEQIPKFDYELAEILFNGIIGEFSGKFKNVPLIRGKLKEYSLINGKTADFTGKIDFKKLFARSKNKLEAIHNITDFEYKNLEKQLREVILLDYIGKGDSEGVNILSVFDKLQDIKTNIGILTGSLIVIPNTAKEELYTILNNRNIEFSKVLTTEFNTSYLRVETYGNIDIVAVITELFEKGYMNILIGTSALLGEGWDSPCVNTLIIASVVGSFMLSNQMRGRALRIDKNNPNKTSNIWHLVSLTNNEQSPDLQTAEKRFNTFEGISYKDNKIQSGIQRLALNDKDLCCKNCNVINSRTFKYAGCRNELSGKWKQAFEKVEKNTVSKMYQIAELNTKMETEEEYSNFIEKLIGNVYRRQKLNFSQNEQIKIANCIVKTLCDMGKIKTPIKNIKIKLQKDLEKKLYITFLNCTDAERNLFIKSFCDIFTLSDNTRYLLKIHNQQSIKYIPIPEIIGLKKEYVKNFSSNIKKDFGTYVNWANLTDIKIPISVFLMIQTIFCISMCIMEVPFIALTCIPFFMLHILSMIRETLIQQQNFDTIYTKSAQNRQEVLKAKYNIYLTCDIKQSRVWI